MKATKLSDGMEATGGQDEIARSLGRLEGEMQGIASRFDAVDAKFSSVYERFNSVDARFDGVDARFNSLEARLDRVEVQLDRVIFGMFGFGSALIAGMVGILVKLFI